MSHPTSAGPNLNSAINIDHAMEVLQGYVMVPIEYIKKLEEVTDADLTFAVTRPVQLSSILCSSLYDEAVQIKHATDVAYSVHCAVKAMDDAISDVLGHGVEPMKLLSRLAAINKMDSRTSPGTSAESAPPAVTRNVMEQSTETIVETTEYKREESKGFLLSQVGELYRHIGLIPLHGHRNSARAALDRMTRELTIERADNDDAS